VVEAVPRIRTAVLADNGTDNQPAMVIGADLEREVGYLDILAMISEGSAPRTGEPELLLGYLLAEQLQVAVGDTLTLLGQTAYRSLGGIRATITGLASTGIDPLDRMTVFLPLDQAQYMTDLYDSTTEILVFVEDPDLARAVAESLHEELDPLVIGGVEAVSWMDQNQFMQLLDMADVIYAAIMGLFLFMAGLIIVNTMLMTVMERTQEFGMLGAMGMRNRGIISLIISEGLIIGLIGAGIGAGIGSGFAIWLEKTGLNMAKAVEGMDWPISGVFYPDWQVSHALIGIALGVLTAGLATLLPARRAVRMRPAEALRE
jgi:putative ABC transport system permease protein